MTVRGLSLTAFAILIAATTTAAEKKPRGVEPRQHGQKKAEQKKAAEKPKAPEAPKTKSADAKVDTKPKHQ
jgi:hypothetical protein